MKSNMASELEIIVQGDKWVFTEINVINMNFLLPVLKQYQEKSYKNII